MKRGYKLEQMWEGAFIVSLAGMAGKGISAQALIENAQKIADEAVRQLSERPEFQGYTE